jgi:hypothetical protein
MNLPVSLPGGSLVRGGGMLAAQVLGVGSFGASMITFGRIIGRMALQSDSRVAQEMVDRMRADAPVDEGDLVNGITWRQEGKEFVVEASAIDPRKGGADYAGYVERGTRAGVRGRSVAYVADESYFDLSVDIDADGGVSGARRGKRSARRRQQYRTHPGTAAQPYFFHNAESALRKRALMHKANVALAVADAGLSGYTIVGSVGEIAKLTGPLIPRLTGPR